MFLAYGNFCFYDDQRFLGGRSGSHSSTAWHWKSSLFKMLPYYEMHIMLLLDKEWLRLAVRYAIYQQTASKNWYI